ncbi:peptidoglycan-associated lipoprotein [Parelusimicrobium proximum]|uniref:OmpA family protein n=1 Tax=Parelusimicrobium proximum TaxID=3228953 RepID=UPI003D185FFA
MKNLIKVFSVLCLALAITACKKNTTEDDALVGTVGGDTEVEVIVEETPTVVVVENAAISLASVNFDLDRYNLSATSRKVLEANASAIKTRAAGLPYAITVEGNCDERGTISYNIALGEKRASEVKSYYTKLGVPARMITTVSYGKEKPVCFEATERCYAKNRRADTILVVQQ